MSPLEIARNALPLWLSRFGLMIYLPACLLVGLTLTAAGARAPRGLRLLALSPLPLACGLAAALFNGPLLGCRFLPLLLWGR
jgi:hypothetical protein